MATRGGDYDDDDDDDDYYLPDEEEGGVIIVYDEDDNGEEEEDNQVVALEDPPPVGLGRNVAVETCDDGHCGEEKGSKEIGFSAEGEGSSGTQVDSSCSPPTCPVCMERWTSEGSHRVCCIPCGHIYGRSCLEKWIGRSGRKNAKCPQCGASYRTKQIINLYAPEIAVANDDLEKEVGHLREKNESLSVENKYLLETLRKHKVHRIVMEDSDTQNNKKICLGKVSLGMMPTGLSEYSSESDFVPQNHIHDASTHSLFVLQIEYQVDKARVLDTDALNEIAVISRSTPGFGQDDVITKLSMKSPHSMENVQLPPDTGVIRDLRIAPYNTINHGRVALLASTGKKVSILSLESNTVVLKYDLPAPAWSCSWDFKKPDLIYAGLQNGMVLVFDVRQTAKHLYSNIGLSAHPVHTIHAFQDNHVNTPSALLTTSSVGPCLWSGDALGERSILMPYMERHGVCISLACGKTSDNMVASFRPKIISNDDITSQHSQLSSHAATGSYKLGNHVLLTRSGDNSYRECQSALATVHPYRMSRSAIIPVEGSISNPLFVCGEESYKGLFIRDMHSLHVVQALKPHQHPILDIKYCSRSTGPGLLTCISKNKLQVFSSS